MGKNGEYGSMKSSMMVGMREGSSLADTHVSVFGRLDELTRVIQQWKAQTYPKSLTKYKELKRSEEAFNKAQKPWVAKYNEGLST